MAVALRLARRGRTHQAFYHIVAADSRRARDKNYIEQMGYFNPHAPKDSAERLNVNIERIEYWFNNGAQVSDRLSQLLIDYKLGPKALHDRYLKAKGVRVKAIEARIAAEKAAKEAEEAAAKAEEAAAAAPAEEAPAEEAKAEAPAAEAEAPAEEAKAEAAPAEEAKDDASTEEAVADADSDDADKKAE
jgi:small subunit ribosomal protein S16